MDAEGRREWAEIREILHTGAVEGKAAYDRTRARMGPFDCKSDRRHAQAMARAAKFDKEIQATRKLAKMVMRGIVDLKQSQKATDAQIKATGIQINGLHGRR